MSIQGISSKFKGLLTNQEILLSLLIIVVSLISFALGRFSVGMVEEPMSQNATVLESKERLVPEPEIEPPVAKNTPNTVKKSTDKESGVASEGGYVASKNGTKYYLPWCGGVKRIKEENKVWFTTKEEAEAAGFTAASNCKGI